MKASGLTIIAWLIGAFILIFLVVPVAQVLNFAFNDKQGNFSFVNFLDFFDNSLFIESFINSFYVSILTVVVSSLFALPLAYWTTKFNFKGSLILYSISFIPLIMPPFVGTVAMKLIFGVNGSLNLLLNEYFGFTLDFMQGLHGMVLVESIHYFPFIMLIFGNSLNKIDRSMEETALVMGVKGFSLFRRIIFPLTMPAYMAGAGLVFVKVFGDLGTPLLLNISNMLAPQAYLRIKTIGIDDPMGYVIAVILVGTSIFAFWVANIALNGKDFSMIRTKGNNIKKEMKPIQKLVSYTVIFSILLLVLSPHIALVLLSLGTVWSYSVLPDGFTLEHYKSIFDNAIFIKNTLLYCSLAAGIDVLLAFFISYIVLRTNITGRGLLDNISMGALAVPGIVIGIGYLRTFNGITNPLDGQPLSNWWFMIVLVLAVLRLPYAVCACKTVLVHISKDLEQSASTLGANMITIYRKILIPLMFGGLITALIMSFTTATVELGATIMLVSTEMDAPLSYGIYTNLLSASGQGPAAALAVFGILIVGIGTYVSKKIISGANHV